MKTFKFITALFLLVSLSTSCGGQANTQKNKTSDKVEMYYFHFTRRCVTCTKVETVSKEAVKELYGDKVTFAEYNLETEEGKKKGKEIGVGGQSLLVVAGDQKIDLTSQGFMNAKSNPDKLKQIIKEKIDPLLAQQKK